MVIMRNDGKTIIIEDVMFVLGMKYNLLNVGQLIDKGFLVTMKKMSRLSRLILEISWC